MAAMTESLFFYGFIISKPNINALFSALSHRDGDEVAKRQENEVSYDELDELVEDVYTWMYESKKPFRVFSNSREDAEDGDPQVILCYSSAGVGGSDGDNSGRNKNLGDDDKKFYEDEDVFVRPCSVKIGSRMSYGQSFGVIPQPWADKKSVEKANKAFKELEEDPVMQAARIKVVPQWIQGVSI